MRYVCIKAFYITVDKITSPGRFSISQILFLLMTSSGFISWVQREDFGSIALCGSLFETPRLYELLATLGAGITGCLQFRELISVNIWFCRHSDYPLLLLKGIELIFHPKKPDGRAYCMWKLYFGPVLLRHAMLWFNMDVFFLNKCQIHVHFISCMEPMHTFESISDYFAERHFSPTFFFALRPIYSWRENNPQRPLLWSHVPVAHVLHIRPSDYQRFLVVSWLHDIY